MSTKKKILIILAGIIVVALAIVGVIALNGNKYEAIKPGQSQTQTSDPKETGAPSAGTETVRPTVDAKAEDKKQLEAVTAVENFSQEDVKDVVQLSTDYAINSLANGYFLSGQWDADGNPNDLDAAVGRFFTEDIRKKIIGFDTNPATSKTLGTDVFPLVFFVRENGNISPNIKCNDVSTATAPSADLSVSSFNCPIDGVDVGNITYVPTITGETPGIRTTFTATAKIPIKIDGDKDGYTNVSYQYTLNFVANEKLDPDVNPNKFVISEYNVKIDMSAVVEL